MPESLSKSYSRRSLTVGIVALLLVMLAVMGVAPSEGGVEDSLRQLVETHIREGKQQLENGVYAEAEKKFLMAQSYQEYLSPTGQKELLELIKRAQIGSLKRGRVEEALRAANELIKQNDLEQAKARLEEIRNDEALTKKERETLPGAIQQLNMAIREEQVRRRREARDASRRATTTTRRPTSKRLEQSNLKKRQKEVAEVYYRSLGYYDMGRLSKAREGFVKVIASGLIPAKMVQSLEGYIAAIDTRLGARANGGWSAEPVAEPKDNDTEILAIAEPDIPAFDGIEPTIERKSVVGADVVEQREVMGAAGAGGYIQIVLRKRNIIRSHTKAAVLDAERKADRALDKGDFEEAKRVVATARYSVNENEIHLGDELFAEYSGRLVAKEQGILKREAETKRFVEEEGRAAAIKAADELRTQMDKDREDRIAELMKSAEAFAREGRYEAALGLLESLLVLDPLDDEALTLKDTLDDMIYFKKEKDLQKEAARRRAESLLGAVESGIPYEGEVTYSKKWREIVEKPTRKPDEPIGLEPADMAIYKQLDEVVDLSALTPTMLLSAAMDEIKNAVDPPLTMVVLWRDLYDNAEVEPTTEINMDGLSAVRLGTGLDNLLKAVTGGLGEEIGYIVDNGVITIATTLSLPSKLETRVYDITDLAGQQANFQGMGGGMMGMMGGRGGGMYGGGGGGMYGGGGGMYGGGGMMGGMMGMRGGGGYQAQSLVSLIMQTIDPDSWFELNEETGEGEIMLYPSNQPKKLAVLQTREVHKKIENLLMELRKALGNQVSIEARYLVVSENFLEDIGLDLDFAYVGGPPQGIWTYDQGSSLMTQPDVSTKVPGSLGGVGDAMLIQGGYSGFILNDLQVSFLLRATQAHTDAKTLTAPKVTVLSGESASFSVQTQVSYALPPDTTTSASPGVIGSSVQSQSIQQNVNSIQVGSSLNITPIISHDKKNVLLYVITQLQDLLRMKSHMVEGPIGADGTVQTYTITVPETETSSVMTRVSVPDGGTLLLGGQKITAEIEKEAGVPILSKIPLLGRLFSNRSRVRDHKILLILVKPTIILQEEREAEALAAIGNGY